VCPSRRTGVVLALVAICGSDLSAQWPEEITPGARIRVRLPEVQYQLDGPRGQPIRGRVTNLSTDTIHLAVGDSVGSLAIPRLLIQRIDVSRGSPSRGMSALQRGAVSGVIGALYGLLAAGLYEDSDGIDEAESALIGGGVGLAVGAVFGAIWPHERWKRVKLKP
jgi:hypothetical protein